MMKKFLSLLILTGFLLADPWFQSDSEAMAIYNRSDSTFHVVTFICGFFCSNTWTIHPGKHKSRPGEDGHVFLTVNALASVTNSCSVDKHGWVVIGPKHHHIYTGTSYDSHGREDNTCLAL